MTQEENYQAFHLMILVNDRPSEDPVHQKTLEMLKEFLKSLISNKVPLDEDGFEIAPKGLRL